MPDQQPSWVVVFDDGTNRTYDMIEAATTVQVPAEVMNAEDPDVAIQEYLDAHPEDGEPVVPLGELLDSVKMAVKCGRTVGQLMDQDHVDLDDLDAIFAEVESTVLDYVVNNWGAA